YVLGSAGGYCGFAKGQNRFIASGMKNDDLVLWSGAPNPWHKIRRCGMGLVMAVLCAYGSWIVAQQVPAMFSAVVRLPPIVRVEAPQERTVVHELPAAMQPVSAKPLPPRGPAVTE